MLESLCGSKSVERILLFLFVNERCYGSELQRFLQVPLTPIQKALLRLEKGGILVSSLQGKNRVYQFHPSYPFLEELQTLLRKVYTLLPLSEKKRYTFVKPANGTKIDPQEKHKTNEILRAFWSRLSLVTSLSFTAHTRAKEETGWNGKGKAEVIVSSSETSTLLFQEKGTWKDKHGQEMDFSNRFRWTLDLDAGTIALEHLRRGPHHPVFLFHLAPSGENSLESIDSHLCGSDTYLGKVRFDHHGLQLSWRVIGPKKNEEIDCWYA